ILGYSKPRNAISTHVDEEDKQDAPIQGDLGGKQKMTIINESGLYSLILKSKLPNAKKFKRWVTSEVLPTIRKTGSYSNVPQSFAQALRLAADLEEKNQLLEQQIAEYEPKISYLDTILSSTDTVATSQIAADYGMSAIALNKLLNELGVQHKVSGQWILYRKHMNQGYTKSHTSEIPKADGGTKVVMNTKWTQKGRVFIYNLLIAEGYYPQMDLEEIG
ncbi:TPA: phage antirepressor KilAC domain-containing protein, partial [Enterococcus faecium]